MTDAEIIRAEVRSLAVWGLPYMAGFLVLLAGLWGVTP